MAAEGAATNGDPTTGGSLLDDSFDVDSNPSPNEKEDDDDEEDTTPLKRSRVVRSSDQSKFTNTLRHNAFVRTDSESSMEVLSPEAQLESNKTRRGPSLSMDSSVTMSGSSAILLVYISKCENLIPSDSNGLSDPYVVVTLGSHSEKTWMAQGTLDPEFKQRFQMRVSDAKRDVLHLQVFDYDRFGKDEFLGEVFISVRQVAKAGQLKDTWALEGVSHGTIQLSLQYRALSMSMRSTTPTPSYLNQRHNRAHSEI